MCIPSGRNWSRSGCRNLRSKQRPSSLRQGCRPCLTILWMDEILHHLRNLQGRFPCRTNKQWFPWFSQWCELDCAHPQRLAAAYLSLSCAMSQTFRGAVRFFSVSFFFFFSGRGLDILAGAAVLVCLSGLPADGGYSYLTECNGIPAPVLLARRCCLIRVEGSKEGQALPTVRSEQRSQAKSGGDRCLLH